jgi:SAM-dependent methyltransferase
MVSARVFERPGATPRVLSVRYPDCAACGRPLTPYLPAATDPQTGERFDVLRCNGCGHGVTEPVPDDLGPYYGGDYYGGRHGITARYRSWRRLQFVRRFSKAPARLLDVGCGDGSFLHEVTAAGWTASGVERGEPMLAARRQGLDVRESLEEFEGTDRFDAISLWHSFEHMADPARELARLRARLAGTGYLFLIVPDFGGAQARCFGRAWFHLDVPRHLHHFTQTSLCALVEDAGFEILSLDHYELEYDLFGWLQSVLNALLPNANQLFSRLTGKPTRAGRSELLLSAILATLLAPAALFATAASAAVGKGGTLNLIARPKSG